MAQYGNYKGYQGASRLQDGKSRATHVDDERLQTIAERIKFQGMDVLDMGCNTGYVTVQAALSFNAKSVTGIDIDEGLLDNARSHLSFRYSRIYQPPPASDEVSRTPPRHVPPPASTRDRANYFPISSIQEHGHLPFPEHVGTSEDGEGDQDGRALPFNVTFKNEDWGVLRIHEKPPQGLGKVHTEQYDVILALSVIKWLHLEHGDEGLHTFFDNCFGALRHGGHLVIEIQPFESYMKAVRKNKAPHLKPNLEALRIQPEDFDQLLEERGLHLIHTYTQLPREIKIYQKLELD